MPEDDQKELFVVVDKNDKITGYKTRFECHHNKNLIHRATGVIIFNDKNEILLQKRSKTKDTNPGMYTLSASGHVGKGESYLQATQRELFEEIGVKTKLKFAKKFLLRMKTETELEVVYTANHNGPFKPDTDEVDEVNFFSIEKIKIITEKLTPYAIESLKQLNII